MFNILRRVVLKIRFWLKGHNHEKIFTDIYSQKIWGGNGTQKFYSGSGSDEIHTTPYIDVICNFIKRHGIKSVVDLGCGDFRVGKAITAITDVEYTGIDVVKELVTYNQKMFGNSKTKFLFRNITKDKLPEAELCVIRQVLQHLSNDDIKQVLKRTAKYKYLIVTEHLPLAKSAVPNIDKGPDGSIRYYQDSGVYLDLPPFNKQVKELLSVQPEDHPGSRIVTYQITGK